MKTTLVLPSLGVTPPGVTPDALGRLVELLAAHVGVEIVTTCARDRGSWRDHYDPGVSRIGKVEVWRHRVDYARSPRFAERLRAIALSPATSPEIERRWIEEEGPYTSALLRHLDRLRAERDAFVFFGEAAATTVLGIPRVAGKAVLVSLDEDATAREAGYIREVFALASGFVFASIAERDRLRSLVPPSAPQAIAEAGNGENAAAAILDVLARLPPAND